MRTRDLTWVAIAALSTIFRSAAVAATIRVPSDFLTIQPALNQCAAGDTVLVAPGTYHDPADCDLEFGGKDIVLRSEQGWEQTTIDVVTDQDYDNRGIWFHAGETRAAVVDGFTIIDGLAQGGGGILCSGTSSPTIRNCRLAHNQTLEFGGPTNHGLAICCRDTSSPLIEDCWIDDNTGLGGTVVFEDQSDPTMRGSVLHDNIDTAMACLHSASAVIESCVFLGNSGESAGGMEVGAIKMGSSSGVTITNCTLVWNWGSAASGGIDYSGAGTLVVSGCTLRANNGDTGGGIVARGTDLELRQTAIRGNCLFAGEWSDILVAGGTVNIQCCAIDTSAVAIRAGGILNYTGTQVFSDPFFCVQYDCKAPYEPLSDCTVRSDSPCLASHSPCGQQIGSQGEGCTLTPTRPTTWGRIKQGFR